MTISQKSCLSARALKPEDAGVSWDAVRMPAYLRDRVLAVLDEYAGAVARDPYSDLLRFFVSPGTVGGCTSPAEAHVRVLGADGIVVLPPWYCDRAADVYRARPVVNGRMLTRSRRLHAAMQDVIGPGGRG